MHDFTYHDFPQPVTRLRFGRRVVVNEWEAGLLHRHGRFVGQLEPGAHRRFGAGYVVRRIDLRPVVHLVPTQEIPTAEGVTVKLTVASQVRVVDPEAYLRASQSAISTLYLAVQIALREVVATLTLDELVTARGELTRRVAESVRGVDELGLAQDRLEIKDIVLPPELRRAQAEVLVARAEAGAALERARGESAALRNLANAARQAQDNPALVQLRLIQALGETSGHTVVIGATPPVTPTT